MSTLQTEEMASRLAEQYGLAAQIRIELLRSYTNDVYLVETPRAQYVLKVYGSGWRNEADILYEVSLLRHLASRGVLVAEAVAALDQGFVHSIQTGSEERLTVLFAYADGAKPSEPFSAGLYEQVGSAAARMHAAADDFVSAYPRASLDIAFLLDRPSELVASLLKERVERTCFLDLLEGIRAAIESYMERGLDWGPCHGDLTLDNLQISDDGQVVFYDFDSGGPGWRASDLPGWAKVHPAISDAEMRAQAFLRGYQSIRPLSDADIEAAPYLYLAFEVWGMEINLQNRVLAQGRDAVQLYLASSIASLQLHMRQLLRECL